MSGRAKGGGRSNEKKSHKKSHRRRGRDQVGRRFRSSSRSKGGGSRSFIKRCGRSNAGMYGLGLLTCLLLEVVTCLLLSFVAFRDVAVACMVIWFAAVLLTTIQLWGKPRLTIYMTSCLFIAAGVGILGGLIGGQSLQERLKYGGKATLLEVNRGHDASPGLFKFSDVSYVKSSLAGVVVDYGQSYCVAPILPKQAVPVSSAGYFAVNWGCCSGVSRASVESSCPGWNGLDAKGSLVNATGEVIFPDEYLRAATSKATEWHDFSAKAEPVYIRIMSAADHEAAQSKRAAAAWIPLIVTPVLWPIFAIAVSLIRMLMLLSCGMKEPGYDYEPIIPEV